MNESKRSRSGWRRDAAVLAAIACTVIATVAVAASPACGQCQYEVTIIQAPECPPFGFPPTIGVGLNDNGDLVGYYASGVVGPDRPFIWTADGGFQSMPLPPGAYEARFSDINNTGQICGEMTIPDVGYRGFFYDNGEYTELPPLSGVGWSGANAINADGQVVGYRSIGPDVNPYNAFVWSQSAGFTDLGVMSWGISTAYDVNAAGMVVGLTGSPPWADGFVWDDGELTMLGPVPGGDSSGAYALNARGDIAGYGHARDGGGQVVSSIAFMWSAGAWQVLEPLTGHESASARHINDVGQIIGFSAESAPPSPGTVVVWIDGTPYDLTLLIPPGSGLSFEAARGINADGQILARAHNGSGNVVAVLLTPIDRPVGDVTGDCSVDHADLEYPLSEWGLSESPADVNHDGTVNVLDLLILLAEWTS